MPQDPTITPTEVKAPHGAREMTITWADGHRSPLPHEVLRGYCPCAHCQGHGSEIRFVDGGDQDLRDIERVGSYALQLVWGDRHDTGIYTFRYLRALCQCDECAPRSRYPRPAAAAARSGG
jgi:prepilin-type processing-associated H-X9-DG protein